MRRIAEAFASPAEGTAKWRTWAAKTFEDRREEIALPDALIEREWCLLWMLETIASGVQQNAAVNLEKCLMLLSVSDGNMEPTRDAGIAILS